MRKKKLPLREIGICKRIKQARELVGLTQEKCAKLIAIERGALANYELMKAPIKYEIGLRLCRKLVINEEWLATGKFLETRQATIDLFAVFPQIDPEEWSDEFYIRQCMDLLSESAIHEIRPGALLSEAYDNVLSPVFAGLIESHCWMPRVILKPSEHPGIYFNYLNVIQERFLKIIQKEEMRLEIPCNTVSENYMRLMINVSAFVFKKYMSIDPGKNALEGLAWLKDALNNPEAEISPIRKNSLIQ